MGVEEYMGVDTICNVGGGGGLMTIVHKAHEKFY